MQDVTSSFVFGCTFSANTIHLFSQQGHATQTIYSVAECLNLLEGIHYNMLGYFVESPNITASGMPDRDVMFASTIETEITPLFVLVCANRCVGHDCGTAWCHRGGSGDVHPSPSPQPGRTEHGYLQQLSEQLDCG